MEAFPGKINSVKARFSSSSSIKWSSDSLLFLLAPSMCVCGSGSVCRPTECVRSTAMILDKAMFQSSSVKALVTSPWVAWRMWSSTTKNLFKRKAGNRIQTLHSNISKKLKKKTSKQCFRQYAVARRERSMNIILPYNLVEVSSIAFNCLMLDRHTWRKDIIILT